MKNMIAHWGALAATVAVAASSHAQLPAEPRIGINVGYGFSGGIERPQGGTARLQGPVVAFNVPIGETAGFAADLTASAFFGGRLISGGDADGDVLRLMVTGRRPIGETLNLVLGGGVSVSSARGNAFRNESGGVLLLGAGYRLRGFQERFAPWLEFHVYTSPQSSLRSTEIVLSGRL
jgi:phage tail tape-measure protein